MPRALHLAARPAGTPKDSDFDTRERVAAPLEDGQFRVAVKFLSIDPAMRVWMSEAKSYWPPVPLGDVMRAQVLLQRAHAGFCVVENRRRERGVRRAGREHLDEIVQAAGGTTTSASPGYTAADASIKRSTFATAPTYGA